MLRDKDIGGVVRAVAPRITRWHLATLPGARGADAADLLNVLARENIRTPCQVHQSVAAALAAARNEAGEIDKIVVFGSFLTVAGAYG
jgi:dihydrofolate synthase/folylpolyglutamate synthase